jgi:hypothetical protein
MVAMPYDPKFADVTDPQIDTAYTIYVDVNGRLHAGATGEIKTPITVDR